MASQWGSSNKYPQHMFLGVLNTEFLNSSNYLPHLELRNRSAQIVVVANFVVISSVGIKRFDCTCWFEPSLAAFDETSLMVTWLILSCSFQGISIFVNSMMSDIDDMFQSDHHFLLGNFIFYTVWGKWYTFKRDNSVLKYLCSNS